MTSEGFQPYTTISYANGPGYADHWDVQTGNWRNVSGMDTEADTFRQMAAFPLRDETHGGEDVTVYAVGPQAHLLTGVHEQSYLPQVVTYHSKHTIPASHHSTPRWQHTQGAGGGRRWAALLVRGLPWPAA